jgi:hypothetical protein
MSEDPSFQSLSNQDDSMIQDGEQTPSKRAALPAAAAAIAPTAAPANTGSLAEPRVAAGVMYCPKARFSAAFA